MVSMFPSSVVFFSMRSTNSSAKILVFHRTRKRASRRVNGKHFQGVPMLGQPRRRSTEGVEGLRCGEGPERNRGATGRGTAGGAGSAEFCCSVAVKTGDIGKGSWEREWGGEGARCRGGQRGATGRETAWGAGSAEFC